MDGQVMIIFAVASIILIGFVALSIDAGFLTAERRQVQNAADAAALAAALSIQDGHEGSVVQAAAVAYAETNAGVEAGDVDVQWPPETGRYAGDRNYVQVIVEKEVERYFIGAVYDGPWAVSASAIAGVEPIGFDAALLALNSNAGGIETSGNTTIRTICGSVVSNYNLKTSGSTTIRAIDDPSCPDPTSAWVVANDGFNRSGWWDIKGDTGTKDNGAEIPDPLADKIDPPTLPNKPSDPVPMGSPANVGGCRTYSPWSEPVVWSINSSLYANGGANCVNIQNIPGDKVFSLNHGQYKFNNSGINVGGGNSGPIVLRGGVFNFTGNNGKITVGGNTPQFEMGVGEYSFTGANGGIFIGGSAPNNILWGGTYYFGNGSKLQTGGNHKLTVGPGTYIFDGGTGLSMSGSDKLHFMSGNYTLYFTNGADWSFSGNSHITFDSGAYVRAYFLGGSGEAWSDLAMSGSTAFKMPPGEYYFDHGRFLHSGSTTLSGDEVFLYFKNGGYLSASGSASFGFTAPKRQIYNGYYPGVFMYSDRNNTATFNWTGSTTSVSKGTIYLPKSPVKTSGNAYGTSFEGQFIADRFITSGGTSIEVRYVEYVQTEIPKVYLVD